jgi:ABC-type multidrug transport system fused ATPase/permease subunit
VVLFGAVFFILWYGAKLVQNDVMSIGQLVAFISYTAIIGGAMGSLGNFYTQILSAIGGTERIQEILENDGELDISDQGIKDIKIKGRIEFRDVSFTYPTRDDIEVLKNIDFIIEPGKKIALVGASGAGKSTIASLLLRFYPVNKGNILVDGKEIQAFNLGEYRRNLGVVPQEVLLFGGSIFENILYGRPDAGKDEVIEAAKKANAWEFIQRFPDGLNTIVGERGVKLSGGQRQRIAIARAILRNPSILILDEATSSLDAESEKNIQEALLTLLEGRTSIIIAHRLSTVRDADRIMVLEQGRIVEEGTHDQLSAIPEGVYNKLARLQFDI